MVYLKKGQLINAVAAIAALSAVLAGCGGEKTSSLGPTIDIDGKARTISVYVRRTVVTAPGTAAVGDFSTTPDGPIINALVPGGINVTAGDVVNMIDSSLVLLPGLHGSTGGRQITLDDPLGGEVTTGLELDEKGVVVATPSGGVAGRAPGDGFFILPARTRSYRFKVYGPLEIIRPTGTLTVQRSLTLYIPVIAFSPTNVLAGIPIGTKGKIPTNGGSSFSLALDVTTNGYFQSYDEILDIQKSNGQLYQKRRTGSSAVSQDKTVTFSDFTDSGNSTIPANGVTSVTWKLFSGSEPGL
jgi:hypothetical protein